MPRPEGMVSERTACESWSRKCLDHDMLLRHGAVKCGIFMSSEWWPSTKRRGDKMSPTEVERG